MNFRRKEGDFEKLILTIDKNLEVCETSYEKTVFNPVCGTIINSIVCRFNGLPKVLDIFGFINPDVIFDKKQENYALKCAQGFCISHESDVSSDLPRQVQAFSSAFRSEAENLTSVDLIARRLLETGLEDSFLDIITVCRLFLTLPITVATAERSFSKLKLIKNYLRSAMGQERLSGISILNIEQERKDLINIKELVHEFSRKKARRVKF